MVVLLSHCPKNRFSRLMTLTYRNLTEADLALPRDLDLADRTDRNDRVDRKLPVLESGNNDRLPYWDNAVAGRTNRKCICFSAWCRSNPRSFGGPKSVRKSIITSDRNIGLPVSAMLKSLQVKFPGPKGLKYYAK